MLPVAHGDAIWIEYGDLDGSHHILIDAGPASTYQTVQKWLLSQAPAALALDLLVVTHIDADHIDGAILMLADMKDLGVSFKDIWFNGWRQLAESEASDDTFGPLQGEFLGAQLSELALPWNLAFSGGPIVVPESGELPMRTLPGGAKVSLLSPGLRQLRRLRRNWATVVRDAGWTPGDESAARARLNARRDYEPPGRIDDFAGKTFGTDNAVANGSSIAFAFEYRGARCLFTGDAWAEVLAESIGRLPEHARMDRVSFDLVKLPHHGSRANVDVTLLESLRAPCFLVSTNGAKFNHPDEDALELVVRHAGRPHPELVFNYESETTRSWADPERQSKLDYVARFAVAGQPIEVEVPVTKGS
jgi:hypothetical protein